MLFKRFRSGADSLPDALVMLTGDGHIFWCNGLGQQLLSFRWPEDNGQPILNLLRYPEFNDYLQRQTFQRLWGGNHFWTLKGNDGLAGSPLLARLTVILQILDSSQKNERKMIFLHYILDWIGRGLSKFKSRLNIFC